MERIELDDFHYHEVVDRASVATDSWFEHIEEHVVVLANPELKERAEEVTAMMYQFYCLAAIYSEKELAKEEGKTRAEIYEYED